MVYILGSETTSRCPIALMKNINLAMDLYNDKEQGHLPNGEGLNSETAYFRFIMPYIKSKSNEASNVIMKKRNREVE